MKPSNPKDLRGVKKVPLSTVSGPVLMEMGLGMMEGAAKYGRHNYRAVGIRASVYYDAAMRHLMAWWEGTDIDEESGIHHVGKALSCLSVLRDSMFQGNVNDDRPPRSKDGWIKEMNEKAEAITRKYPKPVKPYTHL